MGQAMTLRPMGLLEIVDRAFRLYRGNFWLFFGIAAAALLPLQIMSAVPGFYWAAAVLALPANLLVAGALTKAVSERYLGGRETVGGSYRYVAKRLLPFIGTTLVAYLFVLGGLLLLIIGAIVFGFWIAFVSEAFIIEDKRYFQAIQRSRFLIGKGVWAQVLVLGLIVGAITLVIQLPVGAVTTWALVSGTEPSRLQGLLVGVLNGATQSLVMPIGLAASILLYYDSRIRKEGFDLEMLARELGRELPEQAGGPASAR